MCLKLPLLTRKLALSECFFVLILFGKQIHLQVKFWGQNSRYRKWADRNLMQFRKSEAQSPAPEDKQSHNMHMFWVAQLESSFAEGTWRWTLSWAWTSTASSYQRKCVVSWAAEVVLSGWGELFPLFSIGETVPGVLCSVLGFPVHDRYGTIGECSLRGLWD